MKIVKFLLKLIFITIILGLITWMIRSLIGLWKKRRG